MSESEPPRYTLTVADAVDLLGGSVSRQTIHRMIRRGILAAAPLPGGSKLYLDRRQIEAMRRHMHETARRRMEAARSLHQLSFDF